MIRPPTNFITRFFRWLLLGVLLFSAAATEALVAHAARGSAPVAVVLRIWGLQHSATAASVGCDARAHNPVDIPALQRRVGGR